MPPKRKASSSAASSKRNKVTEPPVVTDGRIALEEYEETEGSDSNAQKLIAYVRYLEDKVKGYEKAETSLARKGGKELSEAEINADAERLRGTVERGITKLMKWKPSCKYGSATFSFEGICSTPAVMASFLGLNKPEDVMKFKAKRYTYKEFEEKVILNTIHASARYSRLYLTGNVNLRWNHGTGEYKFTGKYGVYGTGEVAATASTATTADAAANANADSDADADDDVY